MEHSGLVVTVLLLVALVFCGQETTATLTSGSEGFFEDFSGDEWPGWEEYVLEGPITGDSRGWVENGTMVWELLISSSRPT